MPKTHALDSRPCKKRPRAWFAKNNVNAGLINAMKYMREANCEWVYDEKAVQKDDAGVGSRLFVQSIRAIKDEELFVSYGQQFFRSDC
jgi:hypothetical protein